MGPFPNKNLIKYLLNVDKELMILFYVGCPPPQAHSRHEFYQMTHAFSRWETLIQDILVSRKIISFLLSAPKIIYQRRLWQKVSSRLSSLVSAAPPSGQAMNLSSAFQPHKPMGMRRPGMYLALREL